MRLVPRARSVAAAPMRRRVAPARAAVALLAGMLLFPLSACTPPQLLTLRGAIDSLRVQVDTLTVRDAVAYRTIEETRRDIAGQRELLQMEKAGRISSLQELLDQMGRLEAKLDEVMGRFEREKRVPTSPPNPGTPSGTGIDPNQLYEQATQDLTQGRYALALQGYQEFVQRFPATDLSDNAQYGMGEALFAQSKFDSAAVAYAHVDNLYPTGDKVPAALYKLALSQEKLGRASAAKQTFEDLIKRYPLSGEAQLARERLGRRR
jgi:tol-pal system protein YbgF